MKRSAKHQQKNSVERHRRQRKESSGDECDRENKKRTQRTIDSSIYVLLFINDAERSEIEWQPIFVGELSLSSLSSMRKSVAAIFARKSINNCVYVSWWVVACVCMSIKLKNMIHKHVFSDKEEAAAQNNSRVNIFFLSLPLSDSKRATNEKLWQRFTHVHALVSMYKLFERVCILFAITCAISLSFPFFSVRFPLWAAQFALVASFQHIY